MKNFRVFDVRTDGSKSALQLKVKVVNELVPFQPLHGSIVDVYLMHSFQSELDAAYVLTVPSVDLAATKKLVDEKFGTDAKVTVGPLKDHCTVIFTRVYDIRRGAWQQ